MKESVRPVCFSLRPSCRHGQHPRDSLSPVLCTACTSNPLSAPAHLASCLAHGAQPSSPPTPPTRPQLTVAVDADGQAPISRGNHAGAVVAGLQLLPALVGQGHILPVVLAIVQPAGVGAQSRVGWRHRSATRMSVWAGAEGEERGCIDTGHAIILHILTCTGQTGCSVHGVPIRKPDDASHKETAQHPLA